MYSDMPTEDDMSLEEFERLALDRLAVLRECEARQLRGGREEDDDKRLQALIDKNIPLKVGAKDDERERQQRTDRLSHFILRLAYCGSEDNRRWFLKHESDLLRHRLNQEKARPDSFQAFLDEHGFKFPSISSDEYEALRENLEYDNPSAEKRVFYKVPFEEALELVSQRRVFLRSGFAYVLHKDLVSLVLLHYRAKLSKELTLLGARRNEWIDTRLEKQFAALQDSSANSYISGGAHKKEFNLQTLEMHAERSFPLCMLNLHKKLRENHHLKHGGRMQLGLFLKGCGLSLEDSLAFWRSEFSKIMPVDKFDKEHAYNIRHNYGREGKRTDYTPKSCLKIIMDQPGAADHHGCPYKHFDEGRLRALLANRKVPVQGIQEVVDLAKGQHYQIACTKCFEHLHPGSGADIQAINHPNLYFEQSANYYKAQADKAQADKAQSGSAQMSS
eukprot:tig00020848_g14599.t1